jgi:hypothetical protein
MTKSNWVTPSSPMTAKARPRRITAITGTPIRKPTSPPTLSTLAITRVIRPRTTATTAQPRSVQPTPLTRPILKLTAANRLAPTLQITATSIQPTQPAKAPRGRRLQRITAIIRLPIRKSISPPSLRTNRRSTLPITCLLRPRSPRMGLICPILPST